MAFLQHVDVFTSFATKGEREIAAQYRYLVRATFQHRVSRANSIRIQWRSQISVTGFALKYPVHFLFGLSEISRHLRERSYNLKLETLTKPSFNEFQLGLRNIHPRKIDNAGEEGGGGVCGDPSEKPLHDYRSNGFHFFSPFISGRSAQALSIMGPAQVTQEAYREQESGTNQMGNGPSVQDDAA